MQSDRQFGKSSQGPTYDYVASFAPPVMLIQNLLIHVNNFVFLNFYRQIVRTLGLPIHKHLSKLAYKPASELNHAHLVYIYLHGLVHFDYCVSVQFGRGCNHCDRL